MSRTSNSMRGLEETMPYISSPDKAGARAARSSSHG